MANLKLSTKLSQQLIITPQLQQAIKVLQMPVAELEEFVQEELLQNPVLEEKIKQSKSLDEIEQNIEKKSQLENTDNAPSSSSSAGLKDRVYKYDGTKSYNNFENFMGASKDLKDHLLWQARFLELNQYERDFIELLIYDINDDGYLESSLDELIIEFKRIFPVSSKKIKMKIAKELLSKVQDFDPPGVASRTVEECLEKQVLALNIENDLLLTIIREHLHEINDLKILSKKIKISKEDLKAVIQIIQSLEPKPGMAYSQIETTYIVPDVYIYNYGKEHVVLLNDENIPQLNLNQHYLEISENLEDLDKETQNFITEKIKEAYSVIKSISHRQTTLKKVTEAIVKRQKQFFDEGIIALKPLVLKEIADDISMHESTVSRVTSNKYVYTNHGIFELKFFLNNNVSSSSGGFDLASEAIKHIIKELIIRENPEKPLSDAEISYKLKERNLDVARRTVAKYRESLEIPPSSKRKPRRA